jgi:hypothetical protein
MGVNNSLDNMQQVMTSPRLKSPGTPNSDWKLIENRPRKLTRTVRAYLNSDLRESFKEVVADGDSVLIFASHSILIVELKRQSSFISRFNSTLPALQGKYGLIE